MLLISGYDVTETVCEGPKTVTYRGIRLADHTPVILKTLKADYPQPQDLAHLTQEYDMALRLNTQGIAKPYALEKDHHNLILVQEDFGGVPLSQQIDSGRLDVQEFFAIALQIAEIIEEFYRNHIIHQHINPSRFFINRTTGQLKIVDLSGAARVSGENRTISTLSASHAVEGSLAYISPEQTGRMNRGVDYRTDFYSLGVMLYEMLTGMLPFSATDPLELVHCHIAKQPVPPHELDRAIPPAVSAIVMKLLAKNAEDRYQSPFGLKADLATCLAQWTATRTIGDFIPGQEDVVDRFPTAQKLYGRQAELAALQAAFDRVSQGAVELLLVSGYSGVGKSALVNEIRSPIVQQGGYFVSGKFEQFKRDLPYSSLIQAFQELLRQILTESEEQIAVWKTNLLEAVSPIGQVIIDVIPEVELIIGKQPLVPQLGPTEAQNRFRLVFQKFINVFTQKEHPLVMFLDDLQWVDSASLNLLQLLLADPNSRYLLMMGAYRDNEVSATHSLTLTLERIKHSGAVVHHITLSPLSEADLTTMIGNMFDSDDQRSQALAALVLKKTEGNPFFVLEFLKTLYREGLVALHYPTAQENKKRGAWGWDLQAIQAAGITDNVVELMIRRIQGLSQETQSVLKLASAIGNRFDLESLSLVCEQPQSLAHSLLRPAITEELVLSVGQAADKFLQSENLGEAIAPTLRESLADGATSYTFLHDRVQQAAYSLIPDNEKQAMHLKIGRLLLRHLPQESLDEALFEVVNHLNIGADLIHDQSEQAGLAELNLRAGKKAKAATAYELALKYFITGIGFLAEEIWQEQYDLAFALFIERAECEYLMTHFSQAETLCDTLLKSARTSLERVSVYSMRMRLLQYLGKDVESTETGVAALKLLGLNLPLRPSKRALMSRLLEVRWNQGSRKTADLYHLPNTMPSDKRAVMDLLTNLWGTTFWINRELNALIVLHMVNLSLKWGNADASSVAYVCYAVFKSAALGQIQSGYDFGKLACELAERLNNASLKCRVNFMFAAFFVHFKSPVSGALPYFQAGLTQGLEAGEFIYAGYCSDMITMLTPLCGHTLDEGQSQALQLFDVVKRMENQQSIVVNQVVQRWISLLKGAPQEHRQDGATGHIPQPVFAVDIFHDSGDSYEAELGTYYLFELQLLYVFGYYKDAMRMVTLLQGNTMIAPTGAYLESVYYFYSSLTATALYPTATSAEKKEYTTLIKKNQKMLKKYAAHAPDNFLHKCLLVDAEMARITGKEQAAIDLYEQAIASAHEREYIQNEAIANELAAKFYLAKGKDKIASPYIRDARYGYQQWGATAKVGALERQYAVLLGRVSAEEEREEMAAQTHNTNRFDIASAVKAAQAISSELLMDQVLTKLMKIAIENAGAQRGCLLLAEDGQLLLEAEGAMDREEVTLLQSVPLSENHDLPLSIVRYVERTKEPLIVSDATQEDRFTADVYIKEKQPKSMLCTPLVKQGKLIGILYLENTLTSGAFPPDRLEVLTLLSSELAIAVENARLYTNLEVANKQLGEYNKTLEQRVAERTQELSEKNQALAVANLQVQEANARKSQFLANMSHELRTPLNAIIGFSDVLLEQMFGPLNAKQEEYLHDVASSGQHLLALINDILDLSKVEAGRMELEPGIFDMPELLANSLVMVKERALRHGIALSLDIAPEVETIVGDERKVKQVLFNLLSNAVKFTPDNGKVGIQATREADHIRIAVRDTGVGISQEDQQRIFEEFQQARGQGFTGKPEGTGLGLTLAKKFVELHGGTIWVESMVGVGSTFTFTLPVAGPPMDERSSEEQEVIRREPGMESAPSELRALIVEDDPKAADLLRIYLAEAGFQVDLARDGAEGLAKLRQSLPTVVILDILLPKVDGWAFLTAVKADPVTREVPVIVASVVDEKGKGFALGATEYLVKPLQKEELLQKLETVQLVTASPSTPVTVLVIDDDPKMHDLVTAVLQPLGVRVQTAINGVEGLRRAQEEHPDVILLDLVLPELNGFEVLDRLAASPGEDALPVVLFTMKQLTVAEKAQVKGRIAGFLQKQEFSRHSLLGVLQHILQRPLGKGIGSRG